MLRRRAKRESDPRVIWDLEKDLEITQAGERRPLARWMTAGFSKDVERAMVAEADRELRLRGERGFL